MLYHIPHTPYPKIVFLVGPTAVGKTKVALELAKKISGEIISCDSMQIYKGMDIVTSKPSLKDRKKVPHHLIDFVSPKSQYDVSQYRRKALACINGIVRRGNIPVLVGGTGLYMSMLIDGIFELKANSQSLRNSLYKEAEKYGSAYLHQRLSKIDPQAAAKIHPNDTKRMIRALEVYKLTGKTISELKNQRKGLSDSYDVRAFCLNMNRPLLYKRIDRRVDEMLKQGLLDEIKKLLKIKLSRTAYYAIGIRELEGYLNGKYSLDEAVSLMKRNSRNYSKRQLTWFRKDKRICWINIKDSDRPLEITSKIIKKISLNRSSN